MNINILRLLSCGSWVRIPTESRSGYSGEVPVPGFPLPEGNRIYIHDAAADGYSGLCRLGKRLLRSGWSLLSFCILFSFWKSVRSAGVRYVMPRSNTDIRQAIARSCGTLAVFRCGFHAVCRYVVFNHVFTLYVPVS